jgi:hypothetical protein
MKIKVKLIPFYNLFNCLGYFVQLDLDGKLFRLVEPHNVIKQDDITYSEVTIKEKLNDGVVVYFGTETVTVPEHQILVEENYIKELEDNLIIIDKRIQSLMGMWPNNLEDANRAIKKCYPLLNNLKDQLDGLAKEKETRGD